MNHENQTPRDRKNAVKQLAMLAMLTAIVVVFQLFGNYIKIGSLQSISLVMIPIVIGAALYGPFAGMWLGFAFSAVVLLSGDANAFMAISPFGTVATILARGLLCGTAAGLVYKAACRLNRYFAAVLAAIVCPVVNTGLFLVGCRVFFWDALTQMAADSGFAGVGMFVIVMLVGVNFIFELVLNCVLSPVIVRLIEIAEKRKRSA